MDEDKARELINLLRQAIIEYAPPTWRIDDTPVSLEEYLDESDDNILWAAIHFIVWPSGWALRLQPSNGLRSRKLRRFSTE